jgi:hypothetical protein
MSKKYITDNIKIDGQLLDGSGGAGTSGQVLSSTGSATSWVSGSGLPGGPYLPLSAGSGYPLTGDLYLKTASNQGNLFFGTADANYTLFGGGTYGYMGYNTGGYHRFLTSGTEKMRITSGGYVGIGETNPSQMLDVLSSAIIGSQDTSSSTTNFENKLIVKGKNNYSDGTTWYGDYGQIVLSANQNMTGAARRFLITNALDNRKFAIVRSVDADTDPVVNSTGGGVNSGTADFVIDYIGNVGVGTTSPDKKFQVSNGTQTFSISPHAAGIDLHSTGNIAPHYQTSFTLYTGAIGSGSAKVTVNSSGDVGIGVTNVGAKLDIAGKTQISVSQDNVWMDLINSSESAFRLRTYNNGTNEGTSAYAFKHGLYYGGTENAAVTFWRGGSSTGGFLTFTTNNGSERMRIDSNGNVGIGTDNPGVKLDIDGGYGGGSVRIKGDQPAGAYYYGYMYDGTNLKGTTQTNIFYSGSTIAANTTIAEYAGLRIDAPNVTATGAVVTNNYGIYQSGSAQKNYFAGNVGIGTTDPGAKLDVEGGAVRITYNSGYNLELSDAGGSGIINANGDSATLRFGTTVALGSTATERMRIASNGNVGIGVTSLTSAKLEVRDSASQAGILITSDGGNEQFKIRRYSNNNEQLILGFHSSDYAQIQAVEQGVAYRDLALNPTGGNVGIGTTTPGSELEVDGEITTTTITYPEPGVLDSSAYNGEIVYFGAFEPVTIAEGTLMSLGNDGGSNMRWYKAVDNVQTKATGLLGITLGTSISAGLLVRGIAKNTDWSSFTAGDKLYLSPNSGDISNSITSDTNDFVRIVGYALGNSKIYFCPDNTYIQNA